MEALGINPLALLAQVVNFGLLMLVLSVVAYKPIVRMLDERADRIRESMEQTQAVKRQSAQIAEETAARRAEAMAQAQEIVARATQAAERIQREAEERARRTADEFLASSHAELERERQKVRSEIRSEMADLAVLAASRIVKSSVATADQFQLVEEALAEAEREKVS